MSDVFISYSRMDQDFVRWLHGALAERGKDAWVDWEDTPSLASAPGAPLSAEDGR